MARLLQEILEQIDVSKNDDWLNITLPLISDKTSGSVVQKEDIIMEIDVLFRWKKLNNGLIEKLFFWIFGYMEMKERLRCSLFVLKSNTQW